jgi:hypothetical protein
MRSEMIRAERPSATPTITRPDVDADVTAQPRALRLHKVVVLGRTTACSTRLPGCSV